MIALALICSMMPSTDSRIASKTNDQARLGVLGTRAKIVGMPGLIDATDLVAKKVNYKFGGRELKRQLQVILEFEGAKSISGTEVFGQLMRGSSSKYFLLWGIFERREAVTGGDGARPLFNWVMGSCKPEVRGSGSGDNL